MAWRSRPAAAAVILLAIVATPPAEAARAAAGPIGAGALCRQHTARVERQGRFPAQFLSAISLAESGRWQADLGETIAWPWTVYAEGRGRYFETPEAAVAEVRALSARGIRNIDVGCMQVNLFYHDGAFASLEAGFDPATNVAYAARFLRALHRETRSWSRAIAFYHSRNRVHYVPYRRTVYRYWHQERRRVAEERRQQRREARRRKRLEIIAKRNRARSARVGN